jgi:hypothetical protein
MNSNKFLIGTLVGGIAYFLLGYLVYGVLLNGYFSQHSTAPAGYMKNMSDFVWWALILSNLATAALLSYIFLKLGNVKSFGSGAGIGFVIGLFIGMADDLIRYATANSVDLGATVVDIIVGAVVIAIIGGIVGIVMGMGKKPA